MSNVYDAKGNLINNPGPGTGRYKDDNATVIDWFDTHPRPVEKVEPAKVEPTVGTIVLTDSADREVAAKSLAALSTVAAQNREGFLTEGATQASKD